MKISDALAYAPGGVEVLKRPSPEGTLFKPLSILENSEVMLRQWVAELRLFRGGARFNALRKSGDSPATSRAIHLSAAFKRAAEALRTAAARGAALPRGRRGEATRSQLRDTSE